MAILAIPFGTTVSQLVIDTCSDNKILVRFLYQLVILPNVGIENVKWWWWMIVMNIGVGEIFSGGSENDIK